MSGVQITDVRFYGTKNGNFLCYVSAVLNGAIALKHMRLVMSKRNGTEPSRLILSMPCRQSAEMEWKELYHPIRREAREVIEAAVFAAWAKQSPVAPGVEG